MLEWVDVSLYFEILPILLMKDAVPIHKFILQRTIKLSNGYSR